MSINKGSLGPIKEKMEYRATRRSTIILTKIIETWLTKEQRYFNDESSKIDQPASHVLGEKENLGTVANRINQRYARIG